MKFSCQLTALVGGLLSLGAWAGPNGGDVIAYLDGSMTDGEVRNAATSVRALTTAYTKGSKNYFTEKEGDVPAATLKSGVGDLSPWSNGKYLAVSGWDNAGATVAFADTIPSYSASNFTVEFFLKCSNPNGQRYIFSQPGAWRFYMNGAGKIDFINGAWSKTLYTSKVVADNVWHHIAVVYDATVKVVAVYIDYELDGRFGYTMGTPTSSELTFNAAIGGANFDEVRLTTRALSPYEFVMDESKFSGVREKLVSRVDSDTIIYAGFSFSQAFPAHHENEARLLDGSLPELSVSYAVEPSRVEPTGLESVYKGRWADADAWTNDAAFHAEIAADTDTSTARLAAYLPHETYVDDFTVETFFKCSNGRILMGSATSAYLVSCPKKFYVYLNNSKLAVWNSSWSEVCSLNGVTDGEWHHFAAVWHQESLTLNFYVDGRSIGSQIRTEDFSSAAPDIMTFGSDYNTLSSGNFKAITLDEIRVTKRALTTDEFIAVARRPYYSTAVAALTFDSTVTENLVPGMTATIANNKTSERLPSPVAGKHGYRCGAAGEDLFADTFSYHVAKTSLDDNYNGGCLKLTDTDPALRTGSFTAETFLKIGQLSSTLDSYVFSQPNSWSMYVCAQTGHVKASAAGIDFCESGKSVDDGKWHHYAYVLDADAQKVTVYLDYEAIGTVDVTLPLAAPNASVGGLVYYGGKSEWNWGLINCFGEAWFDELRISQEALAPGRFLRAEKISVGMLMIVR